MKDFFPFRSLLLGLVCVTWLQSTALAQLPEMIQKEPLIRVAFHPQSTGNRDPLKELFIEELRKITNLNIETYLPKTYTEISGALQSGHADFAFLSGFSYVLTAKHFQLTVLLKTIYNNEDAYRGVVVVRKDSGINTLKDLKGKRFAFVDTNSTSGYLLPLAALLKEGVKPEVFFKTVSYTGHHRESLDQLVAKKVDAVATWGNLDGKGGAWSSYYGPKEQALFKPILLSEAVPNEIFCVSSAFYKKYPRETMQIVAALLSYINKPKNRNLVEQLFHMDYFVPAYNSDFGRLKDIVSYVEKSMK